MNQSIAAAERHVAAFNDHNLEAHSANETTDIRWVQPGLSVEGREAVAQVQQALWTAFPDAHIEVVGRVADGDTVATEGVLTGTHTGPLETPTGAVPATGKRVELGYVTVQRIVDHRIASERIYFDQLEFLAQLGLTGA